MLSGASRRRTDQVAATWEFMPDTYVVGEEAVRLLRVTRKIMLGAPLKSPEDYAKDAITYPIRRRKLREGYVAEHSSHHINILGIPIARVFAHHAQQIRGF